MDLSHLKKNIKKERVLPMDLSHFSKNYQRSKDTGTPYEFISFFKKSSKSKGKMSLYTPLKFLEIVHAFFS